MLNFAKIIFIFFASLVFIVSFWAIFAEPNQLIIKRENLTIPNWHKEHENLKIVVLADIHAGSLFINVKKINYIVTLINKEKPDIVLLLGDYVVKRFGKTIEPEITAKILGKIKAKNGVIAILGNHDWWYDGFRVTKAFEKNNIIVLENKAVKIENNRKCFWVAGLADLMTRIPDIKQTLAGIKDNNPIILLSHSPDMFPLVPSRISITLSGHTHGGQITLPILGSLIVPSLYGQRYAKGLVVENYRYLYVSSGIGTSNLPIRLNNPPEILVMKFNGR